MLLAALSIIITLMLLELAFRIFSPQATYSIARKSSPQIFQESDYLPWTLKPNSKDTHIGLYGDFNVTVEVNSYGLRDYERPVYQNATKMLVLGDSMTLGFGVEGNETYPKQLEQMLNRNGMKYQVFNAGYADAYSADSYYLYLKERAIEEFSPRIILLGFFAYNDITDVSLNKRTEDKDGLPIRIETDYYSIDENNRLRSARKNIALLKVDLINKIYEGLLARSHLFVFVKTAISNRILASEANRVFDIEYNQKLLDDWEVNKKILLEINNAAKKNRAKLIIIVLPVKFQVHDDLWERYAGRIGKDKVSRTKPGELLKEFGKSNRHSPGKCSLSETLMISRSSGYRGLQELMCSMRCSML